MVFYFPLNIQDTVKGHFHSRKISTDRKFSENIIVSKNFFRLKNLYRPITFYKIFFLRKIFLRGNGPLDLSQYGHWRPTFIEAGLAIQSEIGNHDENRGGGGIHIVRGAIHIMTGK
jgi:hypothetical protein